MKKIIVLGSGCTKCQTTAGVIAARARELGVVIELTEEHDFATIAAHGVMSTPGVVVDGTVVHTGSVPTAGQIEEWLR